MSTLGAVGTTPRESIELLTYSEVALRHKVSDRTVRTWVAKLGLRAVKIGHKVWIDANDLAAFFERHKQSGKGA